MRRRGRRSWCGRAGRGRARPSLPARSGAPRVDGSPRSRRGRCERRRGAPARTRARSAPGSRRSRSVGRPDRIYVTPGVAPGRPDQPPGAAALRALGAGARGGDHRAGSAAGRDSLRRRVGSPLLLAQVSCSRGGRRSPARFETRTFVRSAAPEADEGRPFDSRPAPLSGLPLPNRTKVAHSISDPNLCPARRSQTGRRWPTRFETRTFVRSAPPEADKGRPLDSRPKPLSGPPLPRRTRGVRSRPCSGRPTGRIAGPRHTFLVEPRRRREEALHGWHHWLDPSLCRWHTGKSRLEQTLWDRNARIEAVCLTDGAGACADLQGMNERRPKLVLVDPAATSFVLPADYGVIACVRPNGATDAGWRRERR